MMNQPLSLVRTITDRLKAAISMVSDIFVPLSFVIGGAGFIKTLVALLALTPVELPQAFIVGLTAVGDATYYFLPVIIAVSTARRIHANQYLAAVLGCILVYPGIFASSYAYSVLPAFFAVLTFKFVYDQCKKILPEALEYIVVSGLALMLTAGLMLSIIAPLMMRVSTSIAEGIQILYQHSGLLATIVLALAFPVFVMLGFVYALLPIVLQNISSIGYDYLILPIMFYATIYQGVAAFSAARDLTDQEDQSIARSTGITAMFGITEPAMYRINLKYRFPFVGCAVGTAVAGVLAYVVQLKVYFIAGTGIISLFGFIQANQIMNVLQAMVILVIGALITALITRLCRKWKLSPTA